MKHSVADIINQQRTAGKKQLAVLIDPDKVELASFQRLIHLAVECRVDFFFVGGSLLTQGSLAATVAAVKSSCDIPVVLFPGSNVHIDDDADAILFLSLISGRNPDLLIGQHVAAAPFLKKSSLEILSTSYILIDGGRTTTVSYISNTTPIPRDKPEIAGATAMAGEMQGHKLTYLDAGSGAQTPVPPQVIKTVRKSIDNPIIVGGGIRTIEAANDALEAGADIIVVGNMLEDNPSFLIELSELEAFSV